MGNVLRMQEETEITFETAWAIYPRKVARKDAQKAWVKIHPKDYPAIITAIQAHKRTDDWTKDGGKFIPYFASWLNGERWTDELEITVAPTTPAGQVIDRQCQQYINGERCRGGVVFWRPGGQKGNCRECGPG